MFKHETDYDFDGLEIFSMPRLVVSGFLRIGFNSLDDWRVESIDGSRFDGYAESESPLDLTFSKGGKDNALIATIAAAVLTAKPNAIADAMEHRGDLNTEHKLGARELGVGR